MKILMALLIALSANAYECSISDTQGTTYTTMSDTYKFNGDTASMWFETKTVSKNKVVETGKFKKEALKDKMIRTVQSISYKKDGSVKDSYDGKYNEYKEAIPKTISEWMWHVLNGWIYVSTHDLNKKETDVECMYFTYGVSMYGYGIGEINDDETKNMRGDDRRKLDEEARKKLKEYEKEIDKNKSIQK